MGVGLALCATQATACESSAAEEPAAPAAEAITEPEPEEPDELTVDDLPPGKTPELAAGRAVFANNCVKCHVEGLGDAPIVLNPKAWKPRVAQPKETLYKHALEGFWGDVGEMPKKGDNEDLSDDEVRSAVDYIVSIQPAN